MTLKSVILPFSSQDDVHAVNFDAFNHTCKFEHGVVSADDLARIDELRIVENGCGGGEIHHHLGFAHLWCMYNGRMKNRVVMNSSGSADTSPETMTLCLSIACGLMLFILVSLSFQTLRKKTGPHKAGL